MDEVLAPDKRGSGQTIADIDLWSNIFSDDLHELVKTVVVSHHDERTKTNCMARALRSAASVRVRLRK
jgi:hypothetical protein